MLRILGTMMLAAGLAAPALAADLPTFDTQAHCKEVAGFGGSPSYMIEKGCLDMERAAKANLSRRSVEPQILRHCIEIATFGGPGSYSTLQGCVDMEENARDSMN